MGGSWPSSLHQFFNLSCDWNGSEKEGRKERHGMRTLIKAWQLAGYRFWLRLLPTYDYEKKIRLVVSLFWTFLSRCDSHHCPSLIAPRLCVSRWAHLKACPVNSRSFSFTPLITSSSPVIYPAPNSVVPFPYWSGPWLLFHAALSFVPTPLSNPQQAALHHWGLTYP